MDAGTVSFQFPFVLLAMLLLSGTAAAQPDEAVPWGMGVRRVEVPAEPSGDMREVRISPGLSTAFFFDSEIQGVEIEERGLFELVDFGMTILRLVPSARLAPGARLRLSVHFKDGAAPASAFFALVVHPAQAEPLVEVYRHKRTLESYRQEGKEAREEARRCREENERLHTECKGVGGLRGLLATMVMAKEGVMARDLHRSVVWAPTSALRLKDVFSYRASQRVAVELLLGNPEDTQSWTTGGATLTSTTGEALRVLPVWQQEPITSDSRNPRVVVEAEASENEARGSFILKLWEAGGKRTITLSNVTFP